MEKKIKQRILTGITTSGTPHFGNYVGSIRPSVLASEQTDTESFFFLADYHALIKTNDPARVQRSTLEIAAAWLAVGLNPEKVVFYRQSDVPNILELHWILTCQAAKGMLNRAHAYKASIDKNTAAGVDVDTDVNAGLFMYPVLMAADILMFNAHQVPVGRDQIQHIEMARDLAQSFNHHNGNHFVLPKALVDEHVATLPGLDGRKMSKSYDNTIRLFSTESQLKKAINGIITDSKAPGEAKSTDNTLFAIYQAFGSTQQTADFVNALHNGMAWGDAKQALFNCINTEIAPMRERYQELINSPKTIEDILQFGGEKARTLAQPLTEKVRHAVGIRPLSFDSIGGTHDGNAIGMGSADSDAPKNVFLFKQYKENDGFFYFKKMDKKNTVLFQSNGFTSPKEAALAMQNMQNDSESR